MSGKFNGVQAHIKDTHPLAIYVHCSAHVLNLLLKRSCKTRWIERFHAINDFLELYEYVIEALDTISEWDDNDTSNKARRLRSSILGIEFVISLFVLNKGFSIGLPLSKFLQKSNIDLKSAVQLANDTQKELQEAMAMCNQSIYPNIFKLLQILVTLPVSSATNERTFSNLKRIKTYLRNSMSEGRLNGLAMLSINKNYSIKPEEVIEELARKKRRLPFLL
ncbi:uncharacterized protein LOC112694162 [Sipha flava]|uniref:Uncharacterized protein LOC112694162 n=1 Tax=Sipha flava TaxID=143950 RepID=A0A8B8GRW0_9HEMI|nr:uncharacterized protein LOC112694162 [Sipha flava]